jgi:hypothetical protein
MFNWLKRLKRGDRSESLSLDLFKETESHRGSERAFEKNVDIGNPGKKLGYAVQPISLDGDPERIAEQLLSPSLWRVPLDHIDLSTQEGQGQLIARFIASPGKASLEKDEIIRFTERNRESLPFFINDLLPKMVEFMKHEAGGENMAVLVEYFLEHVNHAYRKEYDKINVRSDRLFWLVYVLASQLHSRRISYDEALAYLRKPEHKERISPLSLQFMLHDYVESMEQPNQPPIEMLLLIGEAALLIDDTRAVHADFGVVLRVGSSDNPDHLLRFINSMEPYLAKAKLLEDEDLHHVARVKARYETRIDPNDF